MKKQLLFLIGILWFMTGCDSLAPSSTTSGTLPFNTAKNQLVCQQKEQVKEGENTTTTTYVFDQDGKNVTKLSIRFETLYSNDAYTSLKGSEAVMLREQMKETYCKRTGYKNCMVLWEGQSLVIKTDLDVSQSSIVDDFYTDKTKEEILRYYEEVGKEVQCR